MSNASYVDFVTSSCPECNASGDIGSIGDFAASAEVAFGTILQRTYALKLHCPLCAVVLASSDSLEAVLGARMHYGHPDIMNKSPS